MCLVGVPVNPDSLRVVDVQVREACLFDTSGTVGPGHICAVLPCQKAEKRLEINVAVDKEDRILRTVMPVGETQRIRRSERPDTVCRPKNIVAQRMPAEDEVLEVVVDQFRRTVVIRLYLVADDFHLLVDFLLRIDTVEDDIRQQVNRTADMVLQNRRIVNGIGLGSEGVEVAAHLFETVDDIKCRTPHRSLEGNVLAEMGHALFTGLFAGRTSVHLIAAIDHRRR